MFMRVAATMLVMAGAASADDWSPAEFYAAQGNPKQGAAQNNAARWTFRKGGYKGSLLTGIRGAANCEQGFGLWGDATGDKGFLPCVGPEVSGDEMADQGTEPYVPEFPGLMVVPGTAENAYLVYTASETTVVPELRVRGEMLQGSNDGVLVTVGTTIGGQSTAWLNAAPVYPGQVGFEEWILFKNDHPKLQKGDFLWVQVNHNSDPTGDWANISIESAACYPDCTGDGSLDLFDFLCFVNEFNSGDKTADCDGNAALDLFDFLCFVNAFNTGC